MYVHKMIFHVPDIPTHVPYTHVRAFVPVRTQKIRRDEEIKREKNIIHRENETERRISL